MIRPYCALFFTLIFICCRRSVQSPQFYSLFRETDNCVEPCQSRVRVFCTKRFNPVKAEGGTRTEGCGARAPSVALTVLKCGTYNELSARIVGGRDSDPHAYPWMVAVFHRGKMHCGGSLINDRYVLTAGHCLRWTKKEDISVIAGLHDRILLETTKRGGSILEAKDITIHENFNSNSLHDTEDIGLIRLKEPVTFTPKIGPVCLPKEGKDYAGQTAQVTGWGRIAQKDDPSRLLKVADVTVMSNEDCRANNVVGDHILDSMLCAYRHKVDACQGDSGGPLILETDEGKAEQIGIVSWGIGCAQPGVPGVYTRTTSYLKWIAKHTRDATYCKNPA